MESVDSREVDGGAFVSMLLEKGSPAGGGRFAVPGFVPLDGGVCDIDAHGPVHRELMAECGDFELQRQASSS